MRWYKVRQVCIEFQHVNSLHIKGARHMWQERKSFIFAPVFAQQSQLQAVFLIHDGACRWIRQQKPQLSPGHVRETPLYMCSPVLIDVESWMLSTELRTNTTCHHTEAKTDVLQLPQHLFITHWPTDISVISSSVCLGSKVLDNCLLDLKY